jgi:hypothetical protein
MVYMTMAAFYLTLTVSAVYATAYIPGTVVAHSKRVHPPSMISKSITVPPL